MSGQLGEDPSPLVTPRKGFMQVFRGNPRLRLLLGVLLVLLAFGILLLTFGGSLSLPGGSTANSTPKVTTSVLTEHGKLTITLSGTITLTVGNKTFVSTFDPHLSYVHRGIGALEKGKFLWFEFDPQQGLVPLCDGSKLVEYLSSPATPCGAEWTDAPEMVEKAAAHI